MKARSLLLLVGLLGCGGGEYIGGECGYGIIPVQCAPGLVCTVRPGGGQVESNGSACAHPCATDADCAPAPCACDGSVCRRKNPAGSYTTWSNDFCP